MCDQHCVVCTNICCVIYVLSRISTVVLYHVIISRVVLCLPTCFVLVVFERIGTVVLCNMIISRAVLCCTNIFLFYRRVEQDKYSGDILCDDL